MVLADLGKQLTGALAKLGGGGGYSSSSSSPLDEALVDAVLKDIAAALLTADVNVKLVMTLRQEIKRQAHALLHSSSNNEAVHGPQRKRQQLHKLIFTQLVALVDPTINATGAAAGSSSSGTSTSSTSPSSNYSWKPKKGRANTIMLVGLQGSGKTTTCTKLAHYYIRKGWKVCLVCTDTFRAGAFDQLKQNATKAGIPFYGSYSETDPVQLAIDGVSKFKKEGFEIIIVDTSGRHKQETALFDEMRQIAAAVVPDNTLFVMDGTIGQAAEAQARAFKETVDIGSVIITKMDGHAKGGGAISAVAATKASIMFIGTGEHIHDLEAFNPQSFISKLLGMGDMAGLLETVQDLQLDKKTTLLQSLEQGTFTLRNMKEQFQTITSMGPLSKVMGMMPGIPQEMLAMGDKEGSQRIKLLMCVMDSMTAAELDSDAKCFVEQPGRLYRVARGSGANVRDVEELLMQHAQFASLVKKMGGSKGLLSTMGKAAKSGGTGIKPSDAAKMQAGLKGLSSMLPPGMMEQMGGMGGIQNMMAQMGGMGGIQNMMAQMGLGGGGGGGLASMLGALGGGGAGGGVAGLEGLLGGLNGGGVGAGAGRGGVRRPRKR